MLKLDPVAQGQRPRFGLVRKRTQRSLTQVWSEKDIVPSLSRLLKLVTMDSLEGWGTPETDCQSLYLYAYVLFLPQRGSISFNRFFNSLRITNVGRHGGLCKATDMYKKRKSLQVQQ